MQGLGQLRLLLWKNLILRRRYPLFLVLELIWPIFFIGIISIMRTGSLPIKNPECHYQKWSMPSAGLLPFLRSYVCNVDNYCFSNLESLDKVEETAQSFAALTQDLIPIISSNDTLNILKVSNQTSGLFTLFKNVIEDKSFLNSIENTLYIRPYIRKEAELRDILVNESKLLTIDEFNDILMSKLNIGKLVNITEIPDILTVLCDPIQLGSYITFPEGTDVQNISLALCELEGKNDTALIDSVLQHLNFSSFIRAIKLIEELKTKGGSQDNFISILEGVAQMYDIVRNEEPLLRAVYTFFSIKNVSELVKSVPFLTEHLGELTDVMSFIRKVVPSLNPIMVSLKLDNATAWVLLNNTALLGQYFTEIAEGKWSRSPAELFNLLGSIVNNLRYVTLDESTKLAITVIKLLADWTNKLSTTQSSSSVITLISDLIPFIINGPTLTQNLTQAILNNNYAEIESIIKNTFASVGLEALGTTLFVSIRDLIAAALSASSVQLNDTSTAQSLAPVINQLNAVLQIISFSISTLCSAATQLVGQPDNPIQQIILILNEGINIFSGLVKILPEIDDLSCTFFDNTGINVPALWDKLTQIGFWSDLQKILEQLTTSTQTPDCLSPVEDIITISRSLSNVLVNNGLNVSKMLLCLNTSKEQIPKSLKAFSNLIVLGEDLLSLLQKPPVQTFFTDPSILPLFDIILDIIIYNVNAPLTVSKLLNAETDVINFLVKLGTPDLVVENFMFAIVKPNQTNFLQQSTKDITNALCDQVQLSSVIALPSSSPLSMTNITSNLCTSQVNITAEYLKNSSVSPSVINSLLTSSSNIFINKFLSLIPDLTDLTEKFPDFIKFLITLLLDTYTNILRDNADVLDKLILENMFTDLSNKLENLLKIMITQFSPKYKTVTVITYLQTVLKGLSYIDFVKGKVLPEIQVINLLKSPENTINFFKSNFGFNENVSENVLDAVFSSEALLGFSNSVNSSCFEIMERLLFINLTQAKVQNIQTGVCALNSSQLVKLSNVLTPNLDPGALLSKYVTGLSNTIFQDTNLTSGDLTELANNIDRVLVGSLQAYKALNESKTGQGIIESVSAAFTSDESVSSLLGRISETVCGRKFSDISTLLSFTGISFSNTGFENSNTQETENKASDSDLRGSKCQDLYNTVNNLDFGIILWSYFKPFLVGKILYTPDNEVTRAILSTANKTFALADELRRVATVWADQTLNLKVVLDIIRNPSILKDALNNAVVQDLVKAATGIQLDTLLSGLSAIENNTIDPGILKTLQSAAQLVADYSSCILTNRFQPVANETELITLAFQMTKNRTFFAGIVFYNLTDDGGNSARPKRQAGIVEIPKHVGYKIRMDVDNVMDPTLLKERIYSVNSESNFIENLRYLRGFIFLQDLLDSAIIDFHKNQSIPNPVINLKQMPFPCHHRDSFIYILGTYLVPVMMVFVTLTLLAVATFTWVSDRENGQDEALHVMGMVKGLNFLAWFISTMFFMCVVSIIVAVMLKYTEIFIYSNLFIVFLMIVDLFLSSLMLMYMVSALFTRVSLATLFVIFLYFMSYLPFTVVIGYDYTLTFWQRILTCLANSSAFCFATLRIAFLEEEGKGVQWSNIHQAENEELSVAWGMAMMLIDSIIYFIVGWYIQEVKPGKLGIGQPLHFLFQKSYWTSIGRYRHPTGDVKEPLRYRNDTLYEAPMEALKVIIAVDSISKSYRNKTVLEKFSLQFFENQVTSLLGHNGAAKTTVIKILCGLLKPNSGQVCFNKSSSMIGICPQFNALFYHMTVKEHMEFYAGMKKRKDKGRDKRHKLLEIYRLLRDVDLWHARNIPVKNLSGGMKRRLCVALAFVGNTKTIILDEPTSGVDPHTRKHIWSLINRNRIGRTIVLSTHHLDEADFLSDRILVMHQGKLICCGSPAFLKHSIGGGYSLTIAKLEQPFQGQPQEIVDQRSRAMTGAIQNFILSLCPKATLVEQVGTDLTFNLPKDNSMSIPLDQFFRRLDQSADQLSIASYGLSDTSLEEIFLKLIKTADRASDTNKVVPINKTGFHIDSRTLEDVAERQSETGSTDHLVEINRRRSGLNLKLVQIGALLLKRFHHYRRNWRIILSALFMPMIFFLLALSYSSIRFDEGDPKPLLLDPSIYGTGKYSFYQDSARTSLSAKYVREMTENAIGYGTACMKDWQQTYFRNDKCVPNSPWYNISFLKNLVSCPDNIASYTPLSTNYSIPEKHIQADGFIQNLDDWGIPSYLINTFEKYRDKRFGGWSFEGKETLESFVWFNTKGYHSMPSYYNSMTNTILRSQLPAGKNSTDYGITAVNHPIKLGQAPLNLKTLTIYGTDLGLSLLIAVAFNLVPSSYVLYIINEKVKKEKQLQSISGITGLTYWTVAFFWDLLIYCCTLGLGVICLVIIQPDSYYIRQNFAGFSVIVFLYGWCLIPFNYCLTHCFTKGSNCYMVSYSISQTLALVTVIGLFVLLLFGDTYPFPTVYKVFKYLLLIFPQFCFGQGLVDLASNTISYKIFLRFNEDRYTDPFDFEILGYKIIALAIEGVIFFTLNLFIDAYRSPVLSLPRKGKSYNQDEDVVRERERIQQGFADDLLVIDDLSKVYRRNGGKFFAVNHVSFGVSEGKCFGLLGVNGAGKTTIFRMLTGDCLPSGGTIMLKGKRLSKKEKTFGQNVGYCPQEEGLDDYLTGEEMLYFHARLRGLYHLQAKMLVTDLLDQLSLNQYAHNAVHTYSGGTKRKLALAVAMLGHPPIIYLDEPTSGMDAATRRLAWQCIDKATKNGQSVILTSHSMDECDSLCSTIAIMVNGEIKCIGSPQHLKHKYGDGYTVIVHKGQKPLADISRELINRFPGSVVKANHHSSVKLQVPMASSTVADILSFLQARQALKHIGYYSLAQTTLDSVFTSFAQDQFDSSESEGSSKDSTDTLTDNGSSSASNQYTISVSNADIESLSGFTNPAFRQNYVALSPALSYNRRKYISVIQLGLQEENNVTGGGNPGRGLASSL